MKHSSSSAAVAAAVRDELHRYSIGEKLPSSRSLVERFGVSPVTVSQALAILSDEGLVVTRPGAGVFRADASSAALRIVDTSWQEIALAAEEGEPVPRSVDASAIAMSLAVPQPGLIAFNGGYLHPSLQPAQALSASLARAARRPDAWEMPAPEGMIALRTWFARQIGGARGSVTAAQVLVTSGGQAALATTLRALTPPGTPILVESPTYPGVLAAARRAGLRPVPVPVDRDGVRLDHLENAFAATGARAFYCQPMFQNPTGAVLAADRRAKVIEAAHTAGAFVVEDDYARYLGHGGPLPAPLVADDPYGVVVHISSLTKPTSPNLRVGAVAARGPVLERLRAIQLVDSFFVSRPLQEAALDLVTSTAWPKHLRRISAGLSERRDAMLAALDRELPGLAPVYAPSGGYHLWLALPGGTSELTLVDSLLRVGVVVSPGRPYFAAEASAPYIRLSFANTPGIDEIAEGIHRMATVISETKVL
ncbi:PLP-dependent aminotransferase family protein [Kribbella sp. NPDC051587]|uniref:PLP-dependent aminotransferase family protein n=1 Tax=Kribbella sp. NPDC051587 TaxID=3364119 RepID=UPI00378FEB5F